MAWQGPIGMRPLLTSLCGLQSGPLLDRVFNTYKLMHSHQTVDFVRRKVGVALLGSPQDGPPV